MDNKRKFIYENYERDNTWIDNAEKLKRIKTDTELHIFPHGAHGLGLSENNDYVSE